MNLNKNYYSILDVDRNSDEKVIKKNYYKLSFIHHPDKLGDPLIFSEITEAYNVLCSELRADYDSRSRFGNSYDESIELLNVDFNFNYDSARQRNKDFIKNEVLDILIKVDDSFNGTIEYERWVMCKKCDGSGRDISSKIVIRDNDGNTLKVFDADDGCDFCEGSGKDYNGGDCSFCFGKGKVGLNECDTCKGEQRILGKQKLKGIKLTGEETKIDAMGHSSKSEIGRSGYLLIKKV